MSSERGVLIQILTEILAAVGDYNLKLDLSQVFHMLESGNVEQGIRVLMILTEAKIPVEFESFYNLGLDQQHEPLLLEVMAELNMISDSLVEWFLGRPSRVSEGRWPMRNVLCICNIVCASRRHERATQLAESILIRLHSTAHRNVELAETIKALTKLQIVLTNLPLLQSLESGDVEQSIRVLRVLKHAKIPVEFESFDNLGLDQQHDPLLLEVMAELNMISDSLVEWFLFRPSRVTEGTWPMRNVLCICNIVCASRRHERATQLAESILIRLHSTAHRNVELAETIKALTRLQIVLTNLPLLQFLESGDVEQRMRVLEACAEARLIFETPLLGNLARCLFDENIKVFSKTASASNLKSALCLHLRQTLPF